MLGSTRVKMPRWGGHRGWGVEAGKGRGAPAEAATVIAAGKEWIQGV